METEITGSHDVVIFVPCLASASSIRGGPPPWFGRTLMVVTGIASHDDMQPAVFRQELGITDVSDPLDNPTPPPRPPPPPPHWKFWLTLVDPLEGGTPPLPLTDRRGGPPPPLPADKPQKVGKGGPLRTGRYSGILVP